MNPEQTPPPKTYEPEKISFRRLSLNTLLLMLVYHGVSWLLYDLSGSQTTVRGEPDMDTWISSFITSLVFLCIMGVTPVIKPVAAVGITLLDMGVMLGIALLLWGMMIFGKKINRAEGALLLVINCVYVGYLVMQTQTVK